MHPVPTPGTAAPDFTLPSTSGKDVALSAFRGAQAVLLAFFPLAFTSTCTSELCAFRDDFARFAETGVAILPISVDSTATLREYKRSLGLNVELLSDFKRVVSSLYGVLLVERFYAKRAYFLIDRGGVVRWAHVEANPGDLRDNAEILARISALP